VSANKTLRPERGSRLNWKFCIYCIMRPHYVKVYARLSLVSRGGRGRGRGSRREGECIIQHRCTAAEYPLDGRTWRFNLPSGGGRGAKGVRRVRGRCAVDLESLRYRCSRYQTALVFSGRRLASYYRDAERSKRLPRGASSWREREREREREDYLYALFVILIVVILVVTAFVAREQKIEADRSSRELSNASARRVLRRVIRKALKS